jgi:hypothetical protein
MLHLSPWQDSMDLGQSCHYIVFGCVIYENTMRKERIKSSTYEYQVLLSLQNNHYASYAGLNFYQKKVSKSREKCWSQVLRKSEVLKA